MFFLNPIAERSPDKSAIIMAGAGTTLTYRELNRRTIQAANLFRSLGLQVGDCMAIYMENNLHYMEVALGAIRAGLYFVPVGRHLKSDEVNYLLRDSGAKVLVASSSTIRSLTNLPATVIQIYIVGDASGETSWSDAIAAQPVVEPPGEMGSAMFYSSGTTGFPKGIKSPLGGEAAKYWREPLQYEWPAETGIVHSEQNINLVPGPLFHVSPFGFTCLALYLGATALISEIFDPEWMLQLIEQYRVTHAYFVPTMFVRLLQLPPSKRTQTYDLSSLKHVEHGSGPCAIEVKERMIEWLGPILFEVYGASEPRGCTTINSHEWLEHKGSVGKASYGVIHILDEHHNELPTGAIGDVYFSDVDVEFEYHNAPEKRKSQSTKDGWFCYGDIGYLEEDKQGNKYLYLVGRKSHTIIVGGQNVYPQEVEDLLTTHPLVFDVAVIGVPNETFGEELRAYIQLQNPANKSDATAVQLDAFCKQRLADIKCPTAFVFVDDLPRTEHGKLRKGLLKAEVAQNMAAELQKQPLAVG